jgi:hypothetical protein
MCANDLEGVVAKRLTDPYDSRIRWLKIKNPDYSKKEGRGDLFNGPRQRTAYRRLVVEIKLSTFAPIPALPLAGRRAERYPRTSVAAFPRSRGSPHGH